MPARPRRPSAPRSGGADRPAAPRLELVALLGVERPRRRAGEGALGASRPGGSAIHALRILAQSTVTIPPGTLAKTSDEGALTGGLPCRRSR